MTLNRFCSSGLQAIASAAYHVQSGAADVAIGCGVESISMVQPVVAKTTVPEQKLLATFPALWMPMIETADIVAAKFNVSREDQDAYSVERATRARVWAALSRLSISRAHVSQTRPAFSRASGASGAPRTRNRAASTTPRSCRCGR